MTPPQAADPCVAPLVHVPVPGRGRVRVVQVMATGTNGGAQEHVFNLVSRMDHAFYDVSVVSLSPGSAVRKLQRAGYDVTVIDEPDDAIATGILAAYLADARADIVHNHMYRAEIVGTKAAIALGEAGHRHADVEVLRDDQRCRRARLQQIGHLGADHHDAVDCEDALDRAQGLQQPVPEGHTAIIGSRRRLAFVRSQYYQT